jgi:hypothetical protein
MKRSLLVFATLAIFACAAFAQNTVTGTIRDPNGNPYANGTISAYTGTGNGTTPLALSASGYFSMSLASNTYLFTVCGVPTNLGPRGNPGPTQVCFVSAPIAISANTDLSATLNPNAAVVGPPASNVIVQFTATASLTAGQTVKFDTSNAGSVVVGTTSDTGGGVILGIVLNSPAAGGVANVLVAGLTPLPLLGTGTCTLGQYVIEDTTTNGRVKCSTYTAGTSLGIVTTAQSTVGSNVQMLVQLR